MSAERNGLHVVGALVLMSACSGVYAQERPRAALLVDVTYSDGRWQAEPREVLPCGTPSKPQRVTDASSLIRLRGSQGEVMYSRYIINPRIVLVEDPREPVGLLEELSFTLALPFAEDMATFEFFENHREIRRPSVVVDVSEMAEKYLSEEALRREAPCQIVPPEMQGLPELPKATSTALSLDSITILLARDEKFLIQRGLELNLSPRELKGLIFSNRQVWRRLNLTDERVERILDRYMEAYRESKTRNR